MDFLEDININSEGIGESEIISVKQFTKSISSIIKIESREKGTGFFVRFKIYNRLFLSLVTCEHIIGSSKSLKIINDSKTINKEIVLDQNERNIFSFPSPIDIAIIEIKEGEIPEENFLEIENNNYNYKDNKDNQKEKEKYLNKEIYLIGEQEDSELFFSH